MSQNTYSLSTKPLITLRDTETRETVSFTLSEVIEDINRDRSHGWTDYDVTDWQEGLAEFTAWEVVSS